MKFFKLIVTFILFSFSGPVFGSEKASFYTVDMNKLLKQTNMKLYKKPMKPSHLFYFQKYAYEYQTSWKPYLFMN